MSREKSVRETTINPFIFGRPLEASEPFFDRGHEQAWITYSAQKPRGNKPLFLMGPPGIGKTSLVKRAAEDPGEEFLTTIIVDVPRAFEAEVRDFLWGFSQLITSSLANEALQMPQLEKRKLLLQPLEEFKDEFWIPLDESFAGERLLLVLDDAEILFDLHGTDSPGHELLDIILQLYNEAKHIEILFVLLDGARRSLSIPQLMAEETKILNMNNFDLDDALKIIDLLHPYRAANDVRKYIHDLTGGHPNDLQRLCHGLFERCTQLGITHITMADVAVVLYMDPSPSEYYMPVYKRRNVYKYRFPKTTDS
jgi:hypothetical protein